MSRSASVSVSGDEDQEYHEDSLPDLVLDAYPHYPEGSQSKSIPSSLDLLTLRETPLKESCSDFLSATESWNESEYYSSTGANEQIHTEVSAKSGVFKITYVDHRKAYVVPQVGSFKHANKYRSYLSLMPEDVKEDHESEAEQKKRAQILSDFKALSYEDQRQQRFTWARELHQTETEIAELKEKLAFKTAWCGVLRRNLGITAWKKLSTSCVEFVGEKMVQLKETSAQLQQALETTESRILSSESLQKAKDSFEQLSNEVKDRVKQGSAGLVKKMSSRTEEELTKAEEATPDLTNDHDKASSSSTNPN